MIVYAKLKLKYLIEKREPTTEKAIIINYLTQASKTEYKKALQESLAYNNKPVRIGVYGLIQEEGKSLLVKTQTRTQEIYNFPRGGKDSSITSVSYTLGGYS